MTTVPPLPKLKCILLVDDDETANFLHRRVIERAQIADQITSVNNGRKAMELLTQPPAEADQACNRPDLILLDINMPGMNGWEFLDAYEAHFKENLPAIVIVMLTSALPERMEQEAEKKRGLIADFIEKPLRKETLAAILSRHFSPQ